MTLLNYDFYPTGVLYRTLKEADNAKKLNIRVERDARGLVKQVDPKPLKYFKPVGGWCKSNEPEEHLDEISLWLLSSISSPNLNIGGFSYKDSSLIERIGRYKSGTTEYCFKPPNENEETSNLLTMWPEDCTSSEIAESLESMPADLDIFLMRHYLEHFDNLEIIMEAISNRMRVGGLIYIEVPECKEFFKRGVPLFAWEQHKCYFTKDTIKQWAVSCGFDCQVRLEGDSIEPSICCILKKRNSKILIDYKVVVDMPEEKNISFEKYLVSWQSIINKKIDKFILGIGHNSDRFLQLLGSKEIFQGLIDSNPNKAGFYLASSNKAIQSELPVRHDSEFELILGVHDRAYNALASVLSKKYKYAKISSIFETYGSN